jgi:hypothetical protein
MWCSLVSYIYFDVSEDITRHNIPEDFEHLIARLEMSLPGECIYSSFQLYQLRHVELHELYLSSIWSSQGGWDGEEM